MPKLCIRVLLKRFLLGMALSAGLSAAGAGVTIVTHGLNGDTDGWITSMVGAIPGYQRFNGTNFTCYEMHFIPNGNTYSLVADRVGGSAPSVPESGEILIKLDWRQLADGNSYDTYQVAGAVVPALLSTNFIPELGGHALAELPLHLIGHSRGGSLVCEISRLLGTNGVWVDHLTTLDPHPLNNDGFNLDSLFYSDVDAPARTYVNVLFHDNCWQDLSSFIRGEPVAGAYVRKLTSLNGGYNDNDPSSPHSDVHLWYHGTIDSNTPASYSEGGQTVSINASMRTNWWKPYESRGMIAGFVYSRIGAGDRLSTDQPLGGGSPAIFSGYNQFWDLGAGTANNRTALSTNFGNWPDLIRLNRVATNGLVPGQSTGLRFYYQWARPASSNATVRFYLDADWNPLNTNQVFLQELTVPANGANAVNFSSATVTLATSNATSGLHTFFAAISGGGRTRYLYAPEPVAIVSLQPPVLDIAPLNDGGYQIGIEGSPGQTVVLQHSPGVQDWEPLATNVLATGRWVYTNSVPLDTGPHFYRAVLIP